MQCNFNRSEWVITFKSLGSHAVHTSCVINNLNIRIIIFPHTIYRLQLTWSQVLTNDKSTLAQVMAWCHQATSHYLSQCWPRSVLPYDVTRPQWVKSIVVLKLLQTLLGKLLGFCQPKDRFIVGLVMISNKVTHQGFNTLTQFLPVNVKEHLSFNARHYAIPSAKYAWFCWWTQKYEWHL